MLYHLYFLASRHGLLLYMLTASGLMTHTARHDHAAWVHNAHRHSRESSTSTGRMAKHK